MTSRIVPEIVDQRPSDEGVLILGREFRQWRPFLEVGHPLRRGP